MNTSLWLAGGGLFLGLVFGAVTQRSRFCMVAAVSNFALMRDYRQVHAYLAAVAVALIGTMALEWGQWVDIAQSGYRRPALNWGGALGGGLIFGFGSMLAGGCATRTLVRSAEGNVGSLIALLACALAAMAMLFGVLDPMRGWLAGHLSVYVPGGDASLSRLLRLPQWTVPAGMALICLGVIFRLGDWRRHAGLVVSGALVGLVIVAGWWLTGVAGLDPFEPAPPASVSLVAPLARDALYLSSGQLTGSLFAVFLVPGVVLGALASALASGAFRWTAPHGSRVGACLTGGALMGIGAVLAGGCTVGQGITGLATASVASLVAAGGILTGMLIGLRFLYRSSGARVPPTDAGSPAAGARA
jgi:hypothetical protein